MYVSLYVYVCMYVYVSMCMLPYSGSSDYAPTNKKLLYGPDISPWRHSSIDWNNNRFSQHSNDPD